MPSRVASQIRSHAQKFIDKLVKKYKIPVTPKLSVIRNMQAAHYKGKTVSSNEIFDMLAQPLTLHDLEKRLVTNLTDNLRISAPEKVESKFYYSMTRQDLLKLNKVFAVEKHVVEADFFYPEQRNKIFFPNNDFGVNDYWRFCPNPFPFQYGPIFGGDMGKFEPEDAVDVYGRPYEDERASSDAPDRKKEMDVTVQEGANEIRNGGLFL